MRKYEGMFIFLPNAEEKRVQLMERFQGIIEENGKIETIDEWGVRKLAYLIDDIAEGYYVLINFEAEPQVINELERVSKISDSIMRYMIIRDEQ